MSALAAVWENAKPEILILGFAVGYGMVLGAVGMRLFGRKGWE